MRNLFFISFLVFFFASCAESKRREKIDSLYESAVKLWNADKYKEALVLLDSAVRMTETVVHFSADKVYNLRGKTRYMLSDYKGSAEDFTQLIDGGMTHDNDSEKASYFYRRGYSRFSLGQRADAIADFTECVRFDPENGDAFFMRGFLKSEMEDYRSAVEDLSRAIELDKTTGKRGAYSLRGAIRFFKLNEKEGACADWSKAGEYGDSDSYQKIRTYCNN
jgi:tetratricopeptide (TPR) repeat protein